MLIYYLLKNFPFLGGKCARKVYVLCVCECECESYFSFFFSFILFSFFIIDFVLFPIFVGLYFKLKVLLSINAVCKIYVCLFISFDLRWWNFDVELFFEWKLIYLAIFFSFYFRMMIEMYRHSPAVILQPILRCLNLNLSSLLQPLCDK